MSIGRWIMDKFASANLPIGQLVNKSSYSDSSVDHSYRAMNNLLQDDRVYSLVSLVSSMASKAYKNIEILPRSQYKDTKLDAREIAILDAANAIAKKLEIKSLFFTCAFNLITHGDYMERMIYDSTGVLKLQSLPLNAMTIINDKNDIGKGDTTITNKNFYIFDEENSRDQFMYAPEDIIHVSYNSRGQWKKDLKGRSTYGLYSIAPIAVLAKLVKWKNETISNDIKWRKKMLPKEHWTLDTSELGPSGFEGTKTEKINKANQATKDILNQFKSVIDTPEPDQSIITTMSATSKVLEASAGNYSSPNETLKQINSFMGTPVGINEAFLGGEITTGTGIFSSATFGTMRVDVICEKIALELIKPIKKHLMLTLPGAKEEDIDRLVIRTNSALNQVELESSKIVTNLAQTGLFSVAELRQLMGYSPTTQTPFLLKNDQRVVRDSAEQIATDIASETATAGENNISPGGKKK